VTPKLTFTIIAAWTTLQGIALFVLAPTVTIQAFDMSLMTPEGIEVGTIMHQALGSMCAGMGIIFFFCRNLDGRAARNILLGTGIGLLVILASISNHMFLVDGVHPPPPAFVMQVVLVVLAFVTSIAPLGNSDDPQLSD